MTDSEPTERNTAFGLSVLATGALATVGGSSPLSFNAKAEMRILNRHSGELLFNIRDRSDIVQELVSRAEADLDRLDATAFADEWGFK